MLPDPDNAVFKKQLWLLLALVVGMGLAILTLGFSHRYTMVAGSLPFWGLLLFFLRGGHAVDKNGGNDHER